jgi:pimeloyl-ACP methyl ester carboxylesterase
METPPASQPPSDEQDDPISSADTSPSSSSSSWKGFYKCDDLVPPVCDDNLVVTTGSVETLRGLRVHYWRYTYTPSIPPSSSTKNETPSSTNTMDNIKEDSKKYPILVINGGPGLPHNYVKPTRNLACDWREVVMYDQLGSGASQIPIKRHQRDTAAELFPELFIIEYYAEIELPALIEALGWTKYHILGSSWGTQIAFQFAVASSSLDTNRSNNKSSSKLQSLILNAPIADNQKFIDYQWDPVDGSVGTLPIYIQERLQHFNDTRDFGNDEFQFLLQNLVMRNFNARLGVLVDCWTETEEAGISTLDLDLMTGATDIFHPNANVTLRGWSVLYG